MTCILGLQMSDLLQFYPEFSQLLKHCNEMARFAEKENYKNWQILIITLKPGFHMIATIAEIEKFLSLRSLRFRVATIAKIAECMFLYARKDRSDRCDRCDHMETRLKSSMNL